MNQKSHSSQNKEDPTKRHLEFNRFFLDGDNVSDEINLELTKTGESAAINVVYIGLGNSKIDLKYQITCVAPETKANIFVYGVLLEQSQKSLIMNLNFHKGCIGAIGQEKEDVFLLSDQVKNSSHPNIFSSEDSAFGTHGASIGNLDERQIYYLNTRGLSASLTKNLLIKAKLTQILPRISDPDSRQDVLQKINQKLQLLHQSS